MSVAIISVQHYRLTDILIPSTRGNGGEEWKGREKRGEERGRKEERGRRDIYF